MPEGTRARQAFSTAQAISRVHDSPSQALVTVDGAYAPDYAVAKTITVTGNQSDPNDSAPTAAFVIPALGGCRVAWFVTFGETDGGASATVWTKVPGHGWLIARPTVAIVGRTEVITATGQRSAFIQFTSTANVGDGVGVNKEPATLIAVPVG